MYIVGDELITEEIPEEMAELVTKLPSKAREQTQKLSDTLAYSDNFTAYVIPKIGFVIFSGDIEKDKKICRFLTTAGGSYWIDNKQKNGEMYCELFDALEKEYFNKYKRQAETDSEDNEYKVFSKFIPGVIEVLNDLISKQPEKLN